MELGRAPRLWGQSGPHRAGPQPLTPPGMCPSPGPAHWLWRPTCWGPRCPLVAGTGTGGRCPSRAGPSPPPQTQPRQPQSGFFLFILRWETQAPGRVPAERVRGPGPAGPCQHPVPSPGPKRAVLRGPPSASPELGLCGSKGLGGLSLLPGMVGPPHSCIRGQTPRGTHGQGRQGSECVRTSQPPWSIST